ncbi:hypothetical protein AB4059_10900 [Lysobacter sp. 2RAF19]
MGIRKWLPYVAVLALALLVRESFVLTAWCPDLARGDSGTYLAYAANLLQHGMFSANGVTPDAFRTPGYPLLLAALHSIPAVLQAQVLMGVATVGCVMAIARRWLSKPWAVVAGVWMALQPHHIAATGAVLTEITFGFCLIAALLCVLLRRPVGAGALFGFGYLVNPVIAFLPFLLARKRAGVVMCLVASLAIGGWSARNALTGAQGDTRAVVNLVQGAFPEYHQAWKWQRQFMASQYAAINAEVDAAKQGDYSATIARMSADPVKYAGWYLSKPTLLFDWDIRIGQGGIYAVLENDSPLDRGWLLVVSALQNGLNPLVFCLAFCGLVLAAFRGGPERVVAIALVYLTAVHVVLQAEPRYAIPYRSLEILMAVSAIAYLHRHLFQRVARDDSAITAPAAA